MPATMKWLPRVIRPLTNCVLLLAVASASVSAAEPATPMVQPTDVRTVVADGRHNAFTAFTRWQDQYWLAFRTAKAHNSADGDLVVLRSKDAREWEEALRLDVLPDDRDPQFLNTGGRLFLYDPALKGGELKSFVTWTDDGQTWSKPQQVYETRYIFWKPVAHKGQYYATAHLKSRDGKARDVHLITSTDGLEWKKISTIRGGNWESETTLFFEKDDRITAFLRQKYGSPRSAYMEAEPPWTEWKQRPADFDLSGHDIVTFDGTHYLLSRSRTAKGTGTMVYLWENGKLSPWCALPSGGDCSYPGAVRDGDHMLVSYYSSHEGATNIYLARVPLRKKGE